MSNEINYLIRKYLIAFRVILSNGLKVMKGKILLKIFFNYLLVCCLFYPFVLAQEEQASKKTKEKTQIKDSSEFKQIKDVFQKYTSTGSVQMRFKKEVYLKILDKKQTQSGKLVFSQNRIKMEIQKPKKGLIVIDDSAVWIENELSHDIRDQLQVIKFPFAKENKLGFKSPFAELLTKEDLWEQVSITFSRPKKHILVCQVSTKNIQSMKDFKNFVVEINLKKKIIKKISYEDQVGNKSSYNFDKIRFNSKTVKISYKPPKEAQVIEN